MIIGLGLAFIAGIVLINMAITEPGFSLASRIFGFVCGLILIAPTLLIVIPLLFEKKEEKDNIFTKQNFISLLATIKHLLHPVRADTAEMVIGMHRAVILKAMA